MKLFLVSAAVAALILAAPAAFADPHDHHGESHGSHGQSSGSHGTSHASTSHTSTAPTHYSGGGGIHTPATMGTTTRYHGRVTTTMSPATVYNNAVANQHDHRGHDNRNYNYGHNRRNNDYYRYNNRGDRHGHIDFNRRNVTARHHYRYHGGSWHWPSGYSYRRWSYGMVLPSLFWGRDY